jgi:hypothetical protein
MDNIWTSGRDNTKITLGMDSPGLNSGQGKEIFSSQKHPAYFWRPTAVLFKEYRKFFPGNEAAKF